MKRTKDLNILEYYLYADNISSSIRLPETFDNHSNLIFTFFCLQLGQNDYIYIFC